MRNSHHHLRNSSTSDDNFSFPTIPPLPEAAQGFELGSYMTPSSPADHLFSNGKLLPHSFPSQPSINTLNNLPRSTSRTSSITSIDSFLSSRSNSASSSSRTGSSTSSARTSTSDASERKLLSQHAAKVATKTAAAAKGDEYIWSQYQAKKPVLTPHYSSSRRWQFITPAPALAFRHQNSSRARKFQSQCVERDDEKEKKKPEEGCAAAWLGWRFFRSIVSGCKGCHAMEPSPLEDLTASK